jgi:glycosyltransferase involved in cell wall biosynthesis
MTLRVHIAPTPDAIADDNGIGRIVHAQYRLLPAYGIELVSPDRADVIACHIERGGLPRIDVLHCHGLYFDDLPHAPYSPWHHTANLRIAASARAARAITVPSEWVALGFKRDMRLTPHIIPHGIDLDQWQPAKPGGYALWNKNRGADVCDPAPAAALARAGVPVVTTFGPPDIPMLKVIGAQPHATMHELIEHCSVYLATTPETFGIGTLEAMAAGRPVLGYDWCGTADLVRNGSDGVLVPPGDEAALLAGWHTIMAQWEVLSANARERAQSFGWAAVMGQYAELYQRVADERQRRKRVAVVVTSYNYGRYVRGAIESVLVQDAPPDAVIVVDDGSTDDTAAVLDAYDEHPLVQVIRQDNQGVAAARNTGIAATDCELIVCLDADDELAPDYVRVCADALRADQGLGIAYTGLGFLDEHGNVSAAAFPPPFEWARQSEPTNPPATCVPTAAMFRRAMWERAGGYRQCYAPGEDAEFYTRGLSVGYTARKVAIEPFIRYRAHAGSASRSKPYTRIDTWHPWMRDGHAPFAAPVTTSIPVRSYARPLVSVIIPVGPGHVRYLPAALDSLLGQGFRQWEVIVVDDIPFWGKDSDLTEYLRPYPFARCCCTGTHGGPSAARNAGLAVARAPLCLFLDADDWLLPNALATMVQTWVNSGAGYVYGDALAYGDGDPVVLRAPEYQQEDWWQERTNGDPLMHHSVTALLPTEAARKVGFDEAIQGWEEQFFFADLAARGVCGVRIPQPLIGYRVTSGTVRRTSFARADALRSLRRDRYAHYISGEEAPMGCCGSTTGAVYSQAQQALNEVAWTGGSVPPGMTLVRYAGRQQGSITYAMVNGVPLKAKYRFAATEDLHIQPVWNEDVERLLSYGAFERYADPLPAPLEPIAAAEPTV